MFILMKVYVADSFTKHKEIGTNMIHVQAYASNINNGNVTINPKYKSLLRDEIHGHGSDEDNRHANALPAVKK
jgi:hypothetical protein